MDVINPCLCCLLRRSDMDMKTPYTHDGIIENFSNMIEDCFAIQITLPGNSNECGICEECARHLREARNFKLQVQRSQAQLQAPLENALQVNDEEVQVKLEMLEEHRTDEETAIKSEEKDPLWQCPDEELSLNSETSEHLRSEYYHSDYSRVYTFTRMDVYHIWSKYDCESLTVTERIKKVNDEMPIFLAIKDTEDINLDELRNRVSDICKKIFSYWQGSHRIKEKFLENHISWLVTAENIDFSNEEARKTPKKNLKRPRKDRYCSKRTQQRRRLQRTGTDESMASASSDSSAAATNENNSKCALDDDEIP